ncbi:MAG: hypothetical protein KY439_07600 [Actinobacteria bacterium]|nr:hypothetical protein [Actinomycetota bacterium]
MSFPRFADPALWYIRYMPSWVLLMSIPLALLIPCALLALSAMAEGQILSPRSLIRSAVRSRRSDPEFTEAFVAREFERLLKDAQLKDAQRH